MKTRPPEGPWPRSAQLVGRNHHSIGALAAIAEGPAAITLSRGGFAKQYEHTEPNEDAAGFVYAPQGALIAVADGHHGATGAQAAVAYLVETCGRRWLEEATPVSPENWIEESRQALFGANHAVLSEAAERNRPPAPTTLAFAFAFSNGQAIGWAGIGDSHLFGSTEEETRDWLGEELAGKRRGFLGYESWTEESLADRAACGIKDDEDVCALILATDGLSEPGIGVDDPARAVQQAVQQATAQQPELRPLELARRASGMAMRAHRDQRAGDNIASAVLWLAPSKPSTRSE
ncbi:protein phosphatase 2C domain-containing protein [Myxococcota bacterium]|nr:protein phosphatase 2C domain-containing protein [Myxococcota bacterium]